MRVNIRPLKGLEIGISRTAQWCGEGRPCGADTFWDLLLGKDNIGDAGTTEENEPGNQMAGFDARWTNLWFGTPVSLYGQMIGEDEAGGFPSRYLAQFGIEGSGITRNQTSYRWFVEGAATSCDAVKSEVLYGCWLPPTASTSPDTPTTVALSGMAWTTMVGSSARVRWSRPLKAIPGTYWGALVT